MARPVLLLVGLALFVAGCGGSSSSSTQPEPKAPAGSKVVSCDARMLRATAVDCASARKVMSHWEGVHACALGQGESRGACSVAGFRCQSVQTGKGISVSCARPGQAVAFIPRRGG